MARAGGIIPRVYGLYATSHTGEDSSSGQLTDRHLITPLRGSAKQHPKAPHHLLVGSASGSLPHQASGGIIPKACGLHTTPHTGEDTPIGHDPHPQPRLVAGQSRGTPGSVGAGTRGSHARAAGLPSSRLLPLRLTAPRI